MPEELRWEMFSHILFLAILKFQTGKHIFSKKQNVYMTKQMVCEPSPKVRGVARSRHNSLRSQYRWYNYPME